MESAILGTPLRLIIAVKMLGPLKEEARKRQAHGQTAPGKTLPPESGEAS